MNNYTKGENVSFSEKTVEDVVSELFQSFPGIVQESSKVITCRNGSKLKNISNVAIQQCDTTLNYTIITGHGPAVGKVISLAEIVKRRSKSDVIQFNNIRYTLEDEHWVPKEEMQELDPLKIVRHIPFMTIFLVKSELIDDRYVNQSIEKIRLVDLCTKITTKKASTESNTLSLFYKQPRFWATSLELERLLILVASIPKI